MTKPHASGFTNTFQCGAHARTTGEPCRQPAMKNGRCRLHGGKATGRPVTHGQRTKKAIARRKEIAALNKEMRKLIAMMD